MLEFLGALLIAAGIGIVAAILGLGGGFLNVPILNLVFGVDFRIAIGTSLGIIFFTALSAIIGYHREGRIFYRAALVMGIPSAACSVLGALVTGLLSPSFLRGIFSLLLIIIALTMFQQKVPLLPHLRIGPSFPEVCVDRRLGCARMQLHYLHLVVWGSLSGFLSALTGVGGGIVNMPALVMGGMPIHFAAATSMFIMLLTAGTGMVTHFQLGHLSLPFLLSFGVGSFIGAAIGTRVAHHVPERGVRIGVGVVLLLVSVRLLL